MLLERVEVALAPPRLAPVAARRRRDGDARRALDRLRLGRAVRVGALGREPRGGLELGLGDARVPAAGGGGPGQGRLGLCARVLGPRARVLLGGGRGGALRRRVLHRRRPVRRLGREQVVPRRRLVEGVDALVDGVVAVVREGRRPRLALHLRRVVEDLVEPLVDAALLLRVGHVQDAVEVDVALVRRPQRRRRVLVARAGLVSGEPVARVAAGERAADAAAHLQVAQGRPEPTERDGDDVSLVSHPKSLENRRGHRTLARTCRACA